MLLSVSPRELITFPGVCMLSNCGFYLGHYGSHIIKTVEPVRIPWRKCVGVFKQMVNLVGFRTQVLL